MKIISVFGLGYVGSVSTACLANHGYRLIGVDINPTKVEMVNRGLSPIIEAGLSELMSKGVSSGQICATTNVTEAVLESDISIICVGTPSHSNGSINLTHIKKVCKEIGSVLATKPVHHTVVVRSTLIPGTTEGVVIPILEETSYKKAGEDFGVCFNPEFLREGSSISDYYNPPFTVIGGDDERAIFTASSLYSMIEANLFVVPFKVAEMIKYACNAFHALKVTFANEIGNICKRQNIDSHQMMEIFCQDTKLNISRAYLKPGFAFGGSCLPKDLRALQYHARQLDLDSPVLESIMRSNCRQVDIAYQMIRRLNRKRIGILGFSFKAGTDDLRESPMVELVERLIGKGYQLKVYDKHVSLANLQGANRAYIEKEIPHIASLMCNSIEETLEASDVVVIGNHEPEFCKVLNDSYSVPMIIDLVRITGDINHRNGRYNGICW